MVEKRGVRRLALMLIVLVTSAFLGAATAAAAELSDYLWERRPLLVFSPTDSDPRLDETLSRIDASRCDFAERDMVLGVVVTEGNSTLDGHDVNPVEAQRLRDQYAVNADAFAVLLIGKDGGEKSRANAVPNLSAIYALIDGMPMRSREMDADPGGCG
jgi:hypothetical protein